MIRRILALSTFVLAFAAVANGDSLAVHLTSVRSLAAPDTENQTVTTSAGRFRATTNANAVTSADESAALLRLYPVAGTIGQDLFVPYLVDLDDGPGVLDYNCGTQTFGGHIGHDAYIRGFAEEDIGYPVFAVLDGVVDEVRDGQPDHNVSNDPNALPNYIEIDHGNGYETEYVHLKSGSLLVQRGDHVAAGQQIAQVGSSGMSTGPHIHFQLTRHGAALEPMSGPCRLGPSLFVSQPVIPANTTALSATFSPTPYDGSSNSPYDTTPHTGSYLLGTGRIYVRADLANLPANADYLITVTDPNGNARGGGASIATTYQLALASVWWTIDVPLDKVGTWNLTVRINGFNVASLPFQVVSSQQELTNHAPNAATAALEPQTLRAGGVAVCRATGNLMLDPDYDIVRYHYVWSVNGATVRDTVSAARSDALPGTFLTTGSSVSCSITVSDASLSSATSTAFSNVVASPRRRAVLH